MLTREQIEEIQGETREKGIAIKALLKEKGIPEHQYFWWKRKYSRAEVPDDRGSHAANVARELLGGYKGNVQTDGYAAYDQFEEKSGITLHGCWAHLRRYHKYDIIKRASAISA